jgi:hypothetical protein
MTFLLPLLGGMPQEILLQFTLTSATLSAQIPSDRLII